MPSPQPSPFSIEPHEPRQLLAGHHAAPTWAPFAQMLGQDQASINFPRINGRGVGVAIIDRGIDSAHPQLAGAHFLPGYNFRDHNEITLDDYGHGTGVAGII